ncbi:MAG: hypothetical protein JWQ38_1876 [Flavipsychrobacter sp.]|nr:hypothetical protein [Flavipsychrobacter sp.]
MKFAFSVLLFFAAFHVHAQLYRVTGNVADEKNNAVEGAVVSIAGKPPINVSTHKDGNYSFTLPRQGRYVLSIHYTGKETYYDSLKVTDTITKLGRIQLIPEVHMLNEVKVVEKILAMVQKDDTLEFNSGAYKVNPDADADELIKKMPAISITGKQITAQGENVMKILVDGKPFFGDDPYTSLKNLPADMIAKVQVYNEKSDQEQFTGFSEGQTTKTINIITKQNKRKGVFGKVYGGGGGDIPSAGIGSASVNKYGTGGSMNSFSGDRRMTVTMQSNNINEQNFTEQDISSGNGSGMIKTNAGGVNLSDKWGKKVDATASYFYSATDNSITHQLRKTYITSTDSGQVYNESDPSNAQGRRHSANLRLNYTIDSMNSVLVQSQGYFNQSISGHFRQGSTNDGVEPINKTTANNSSNSKGYNFSGNILYRHKFHKKGRTFSANANWGNNTTDGIALNNSENIYYLSPALSDTLQQRSTQLQHTLTLMGNATYTEPLSETGMLKLEYNVSYLPSRSEKITNDYSLVTDSYSVPDDLYSNSFASANMAHKAGASYMYHKGDYELSAGANYQYTQLMNEQTLPINSHLEHTFQNILPVASIRYKISKTKNLQFNYSTTTQPPSLNQLQNVVNNNDPLHLYVGNPSLKQPFQHNGTLRYNASNTDAKSNFSVSVSGRYGQHSIVSNTLIAANDTFVTSQHLLLPRGSQLTSPQNTDGATNVSSNVSYGMFLAFIKCHMNISLNGGVGSTPTIINNTANTQQNKNGGIGLSLNSNLSEKTDFSLSTTASVASTSNSINDQLPTTYFNETSNVTLNLILWKGLVFNTGVNYRINSGLPAGYNKNYLLWNMSIGKKVFKKHQGDIRITMFDLLNDNNNIQHTITDTYLQDSYSNIIQRYYMLVFTYKIREFAK